ncbi:hypothetical protein OsJ_19545 [Oryza sativa Japonica Group]|uniref:Uncharacterized protein n=1 Tax=Oryza sativa subsp. japonica TaxID=39947 RepID=B9FI46_ORYSJ|nr:hypothetical protein OsJ_19545 [Oryza sativa Japonica Group]
MASSSASPQLSSAPAAAATFTICCAASAAFVDASGRVAKKNALVIAATTGADDINRPFLVRLLSEIGLGVRVEDNRKRRPAKTRREDWAGNRRGRQLRGDGWQRSICDTPVRRETRWAAEGEGIALHVTRDRMARRGTHKAHANPCYRPAID